MSAGRAGKRAMASSVFVLYGEAHSVVNARRERGATDDASGAAAPRRAAPRPRSSPTRASRRRRPRARRVLRRRPARDRGDRARRRAAGLLVASFAPPFGHETVKLSRPLGGAGAGGAAAPSARAGRRPAPPPPTTTRPWVARVKRKPRSTTTTTTTTTLARSCRCAPTRTCSSSATPDSASRRCPRGRAARAGAVYVGGSTCTAAGLTVAVTRDGGAGGDAALEAGALVLADRGACIIDEFDKIGCDHHALLEAMEQQQISIAKAGVVASLASRCAVLAAANPVGGHYDRGRTVSENLKMSPALLSRFDLVFILLDRRMRRTTGRPSTSCACTRSPSPPTSRAAPAARQLPARTPPPPPRIGARAPRRTTLSPMSCGGRCAVRRAPLAAAIVRKPCARTCVLRAPFARGAPRAARSLPGGARGSAGRRRNAHHDAPARVLVRLAQARARSNARIVSERDAEVVALLRRTDELMTETEDRQ